MSNTDGFSHKIMSDLSTEDRWLKYFPPRVFFLALAKIAVPGFMIMAKGPSKFNIILFTVCTIWALSWALLSIARRSTKKYLRGGGFYFSDLLLRRIHHTRNKRRYVLSYDREREMMLLEKRSMGD